MISHHRYIHVWNNPLSPKLLSLSSTVSRERCYEATQAKREVLHSGSSTSGEWTVWEQIASTILCPICPQTTHSLPKGIRKTHYPMACMYICKFTCISRDKNWDIQETMDIHEYSGTYNSIQEYILVMQVLLILVRLTTDVMVYSQKCINSVTMYLKYWLPYLHFICAFIIPNDMPLTLWRRQGSCPRVWVSRPGQVHVCHGCWQAGESSRRPCRSQFDSAG